MKRASGFLNNSGRLMNQTTLADDDSAIRLVQEALNLPEEERMAFLKQACHSDLNLFEQACDMLRDEERMGSFLKTPVTGRHASPDIFEPGQLLIGRFRIVREIGRGGMGIVWEAYDGKLQRRVAIKCAKPGFSRQLSPEVRHAREISHENVCKLFDIHTAETEQGEVDFACMELIEGNTLTERLREGQIPKKELLAIALQLCDGLAAAHSHNVVHGDLKSLNIMLATGPGGCVRAVIMDFGLAHAMENMGEGEATKMLAGTPAYMAPELQTTRQSSVAADIYALGVIFWEMVSGKQPRDLPVTSAKMTGSSKTIYKAPKGFGRWDRVLACCLDDNPARRFPNADDVATAIKPPRSRKWFLVAAAALLLAIFTGDIAYIVASLPDQTVRLAALPIEISGKLINRDVVTNDTLSVVSTLQGGKHTNFTFIPYSKVSLNHVDNSDKALKLLRATHTLKVAFNVEPHSVSVHCFLIDSIHGSVKREWNAEYRPAETKYVPRALAGFVTETFGLPIAKRSPMNSAAQQDYRAGVAALAWASQLEGALKFFRSAVSKDPDSPLTYAGLAEAQWEKYTGSQNASLLEQTIKSVEEANKRNPDLAECHLVSGLLKKEAGLYEDAAAEFLRASELNPNISKPYRHLGETYEQSNQIEKAQTAFEKAVDMEPALYRNYIELGYFYHQRAKYDKAVESFQKAVALAPNEHAVHYDLAVEYMNLGRFSNSESELRKSIALQEKPDVLNSLGVVLIYQRREREAIAIITQALSLGEKSLWWMDLGTAYRRSHFPAKAQEAYSRALKLAGTEISKYSENGSLRANLAFLCSQLGQNERAGSEIAQALHSSPHDSDTVFMAAVTYEALGKRQDALQVLAAGPFGVVEDISRWPDMADFCKDSRFLELLASHKSK